YNQGSFLRTGAGTTLFSGIAFNNDATGSVEVMQGTLSLSAGGSSAGSFSIDPDAMLDFSGGTYDFVTGSSVAGAGTVKFSNGTVNLGGSYTLTGTTQISGSGTANFNADASTTNLVQRNGTLTGAGTVTVGGSFDW